jgi:hypothetical protein
MWHAWDRRKKEYKVSVKNPKKRHHMKSNRHKLKVKLTL